MYIYIEKDTNALPTANLQKTELQFFYQMWQLAWKLYNRELGDGLTECEEWRRWYWEGSVRRSMIQTGQCTSVFYCGIFHSRSILVCICVRYNLVLFAVSFSLIFWVPYLMNQNNTTSLCKICNCLLFWKIFKLAPAWRAQQTACQLHTAAIYGPLSPEVSFYKYYFRLCPSVWLKLGQLRVGCYKMWQFCWLLHALQFIELKV